MMVFSDFLGRLCMVASVCSKVGPSTIHCTGRRGQIDDLHSMLTVTWLMMMVMVPIVFFVI